MGKAQNQQSKRHFQKRHFPWNPRVPLIIKTETRGTVTVDRKVTFLIWVVSIAWETRARCCWRRPRCVGYLKRKLNCWAVHRVVYSPPIIVVYPPPNRIVPAGDTSSSAESALVFTKMGEIGESEIEQFIYIDIYNNNKSPKSTLLTRTKWREFAWGSRISRDLDLSSLSQPLECVLL